jgi:hypothetical protein
MFETIVTPLSSLPTAHPSPEAARSLPTFVRRPAPPTDGRSTRLGPRFTTTAATTARAALA